MENKGLKDFKGPRIQFGGTQNVCLPGLVHAALGRRPQLAVFFSARQTLSFAQNQAACLICGVSTTPHLRALRSPRDPHPPALLPIVHAITASWILLRAAGSAVAARKSHSRACHFGVVFTLPYTSFSPSAVRLWS